MSFVVKKRYDTPRIELCGACLVLLNCVNESFDNLDANPEEDESNLLDDIIVGER